MGAATAARRRRRPPLSESNLKEARLRRASFRNALNPFSPILMARCEQGYLCKVCGLEVAEITESDLYLRYVLGEVPPEQLHLLPELHIRCNPSTAQYIVDPAFAPVVCAGTFAKTFLDAGYVAEEETRVTSGWRRLQELPSLGIPIIDYPLATARTGGESEPAPHQD
jgi:hypothetical protein